MSYAHQICKLLHRYNSKFPYSPEYQGNPCRHKCAACAYELGIRHAMIGMPKAQDDSILADIPDSQAGAVRHKDAFEAYNRGYYDGADSRLYSVA
ncbi:hypothetical protein ACOGYM_002365 [Edwardsiella piscicida]